MSRMNEIAHLVETRPEAWRTQAELTTRPLRCAFVIREDIEPTHLVQILEYASAVWGGIYSCMIPADGQAIEESWWHNLCRYHPDKIVLCGDKGDSVVTDEVVEVMRSGLQPFSLGAWVKWDESKDLSELYEKGPSDPLLNNTPLLYPLLHQVESLRNPIEEGQSRVRFPVIEREDPLYLCAVAQAGIARGIYDEVYRELFRAEPLVFRSNDFANYLTQLSELGRQISPLDSTGLYVKKSTTLSVSRTRPSGLSIVLVGKSLVCDLCLFWNLRHTESIFATNLKELLLSFDTLRSPRNLKTLAEALQSDGYWHAHTINLLSSSVNNDRTRRLRERLKNFLGRGHTVDIVRGILPIADFHLVSTTEHREIAIEGQRFSFRRPAPVFGETARTGEWAVGVKFSWPYEFPVSSELNRMLCGSPRHRHYWIRYSDGKLICRVTKGTRFTGGYLVEAPDAFQAFFRDKGFSTCLSDKQAYTDGFSKLLRSTELLEIPGVRNLLWEMQDGSPKPISAIKRNLKSRTKANDIIDDLVENRVLLRGMSFRCQSCGLSQWHPLNRLDEEMQCSGCLRLLRPPIRAPIVFRMNELAMQAVRQGALPVLLTQRVMAKYASRRRLSLYGLEVEKGDSKTDIDFLTTYHESLVLAECKDFKKGVYPKDRIKAVKQLSKLVRLAREAEAPIVLFSTLLPPDALGYAELVEQIRKLSKRSRNVAVHLLSLSLMEFVDLGSPDKTIEYPNLNLYWSTAK